MKKNKNQKVEVKHLKLSEIVPYWNNPRDNTESVPAVVQSIQEFGYTQPIVVDEKNVIIAGHTRYKALQLLNYDSIDVIVSHMTQDEAHGYRVIDNKSSEKAKWQQDKLIAELRRYTNLHKFQTHFPELNINIPQTTVNIPKFDDNSIEKAKELSESKFQDIVRHRATEIKKYVCPHCGNDFEAI